MRRAALPLLAALFLLFAPAAFAQGRDAAPGSFGEYLEVQLVNVEVLASDGKGRPVTDLSRDEFRVYEDGREVELSHFQAPPPGGERVATASGRRRAGEAGDGLSVVLFVDNVNIGPLSRRRIFGELFLVVRERLAPQDRVMVASYDGSLNIRLPFSRDRKRLLETLREVETLSGGQMFPELRERRALETIQFHQQLNSTGRGDPCVDVGFLAREHADSEHHVVLQTIGALTDFVNSLAGIPGRKVLIHVSDGMPLVAGAAAYNYAIEMCDGSAHNAGIPNAYDVDAFSGNARMNRFNPQQARIDMLQYDTTEEWQRLAAQANAHRVVFYPLFAPGPVATASSQVDAVQTTMRTEMERVRNDQDPLHLLADTTGGRAFLNYNDFRPAFHQLVDDTLASYELAYVSPVPGDGKRHRIAVEIARPGVSAKHRTTYQAKSVPARVADGVLSSLLYGIEENPLGARLKVMRGDLVVNKKATYRVEVRVPLSKLTLLPQDGQHRGLFTVYLAARDGRGDLTRVGSKPVPLAVPSEPASLERDYVYEVELALAEGPAGRLAVAVRDEIGGETSYLSTGT